MSVDATAQHISTYLRQVLGDSAQPAPWKDAPRLPAYLADRYALYSGDILGHHVVFVVDQASEEDSPAHIRKHLGSIVPPSGWGLVYVRDRVTAYNRRRLIVHRVPFLVPGSQMYLPDLGVDLREHFRPPPSARSSFRPATQAVFIHALLNPADHAVSASNLEPLMAYSAMSLGRALDELEAAGLATTQRHGRERILTWTASRQDLWQRAQPHLRSPVVSRHSVTASAIPQREILAGLSALALCTDIAAPRQRVLALDRTAWRAFREAHPSAILPYPEEDALQIEVWSYAPIPYRNGQVVDPLSLALSLQSTRDERVESAVQQMMRSLPW